MNIYCLIIDDDNQEASFETNIKRVLKNEGMEIEPFFINPKDQKYVNTEALTLNYDLILKDCLSILQNNHISVIACDYSIATKADSFTGVDLLADIATEYSNIYKILYSGTIQRVVKDIKDKDDEKITDHLMKLRHINDFNEGKGYSQKVIKYLRNPEVKYNQKFLDILKNDYPQMTFRSCYPNFSGMTLKGVAEEIERKTPRGKYFQDALLEQVIAYLIKINEDE